MLARLGSISPGYQRVILIAFCAVLYCLWLSWVPLTEIDEVRYGAATREMIASHDYIIPTFNSFPRYQKPIFYYWVQAPSILLFGVKNDSEAAARFPSAIMALLLVLLVHGFLLHWLTARTPADDRHAQRNARGAALLGAMGLAISLPLVIWGRAATTDATLTLCISCALLALLQADLVRVSDPAGGLLHARVWYTVAGAAMGLAFLTKGPMGLIIPGLTWMAYHAVQRNLRSEALRVPWVQSLGLFLLVAAPWYIATCFRVGTAFLTHFFGTENVGRFTTTMEGHGGANHLTGLFYYLPVALLLLFPFSIFLLHELFNAFGGNRRLRNDPVLHRLRTFAWMWLFSVIGLFSLSRTQLPSYIHSIVGAMGLLFGVHVFGRLNREEDEAAPRPPIWAAVLEAVPLSLLGAAIATLLAVTIRDGGTKLGVKWSEPAPYPPDTAHIIVALLLAAGGIFLLGTLIFGVLRRATALIGWTMASWTLLLGVILFGAMPMLLQSVYGDMAKAGMALRELPTATPVAAYFAHKPEVLVYYARRHVDLLTPGEYESDEFLRDRLKEGRTPVIVTNAAGLSELYEVGEAVTLRRIGTIFIVQLNPLVVLPAAGEMPSPLPDNPVKGP